MKKITTSLLFLLIISFASVKDVKVLAQAGSSSSSSGGSTTGSSSSSSSGSTATTSSSSSGSVSTSSSSSSSSSGGIVSTSSSSGAAAIVLNPDFTGKWLGRSKGVGLVELTLCVQNNKLTGSFISKGKGVITSQTPVSANEVQVTAQYKKGNTLQADLKLLGTRQLQITYSNAPSFTARKLNPFKLCSVKGFNPKHQLNDAEILD